MTVKYCIATAIPIRYCNSIQFILCTALYFSVSVLHCNSRIEIAKIHYVIILLIS